MVLGKKNRSPKYKLTRSNSMTSAFLEDIENWDIYTYRLYQMATNMFEWKNLPPEIPEYVIEQLLISNGKAMFVGFKMGKYMVTDYTTNGTLDMYNETVERRAVMPNRYLTFYDSESDGLVKITPQEFGRIFDNTDSVVIYNNDLRSPSLPFIRAYGDRLAEHDQIYSVNLRAQKTPVLVTGSKSVMNSLKQIYEQYQGNAPVIFGDNTISTTNPLTVLKTDAPFYCKDLMSLKKQLFNEACSTLGINNVDTEKRERAVTAEATGNMQQVELVRQGMLRPRRRACEKINALFGLNIQCDFKLNMPLPNTGGGLSTGFDGESLEDAIEISPENQNILTGGSEPSA